MTVKTMCVSIVCSFLWNIACTCTARFWRYLANVFKNAIFYLLSRSILSFIYNNSNNNNNFLYFRQESTMELSRHWRQTAKTRGCLVLIISASSASGTSKDTVLTALKSRVQSVSRWFVVTCELCKAAICNAKCLSCGLPWRKPQSVWRVCFCKSKIERPRKSNFENNMTITGPLAARIHSAHVRNLP